MSAVTPVSRVVKPGGYLLLDDSDRYVTAADLLPGWPTEHFVGVKPRPLIATSTSLYRRPSATDSLEGSGDRRAA